MVCTPLDTYDCAVIGIGKLGLCWALTLEKSGLSVVGVDIQQSYVDIINQRTYSSTEPGLEESLKASEKLYATTDLADSLSKTSLVFILVATPTSGSGTTFYDHSYLSDLLVKLNALKLKGKDIVICSTVMPGYIRNIASMLLADCEDTTLSYNPAFVAQGDVMEGYGNGGWFGMVVLGAANDRVAEILEEIYRRISTNSDLAVCRMTPESGEVCKLASNCFRTTKISFANMIGDIADRTPGADKHEIASALSKDRSIGPICIRPGYGYGGPCYVRDNKALSIHARSIGIEAMLANATDSYNDAHHVHMAQELADKNLERYVFEDVTYKPNMKVPMIDNSPKLDVALKLAKLGKQVRIRDRYEVVLEVMKEYGNVFEYETVSASVAVTDEASKDKAY
ncbi:hypothetical protein CYMTET_21204 [Cymbomonas tetramitiformis]|uniref:UDP-glucose 6-dehydrogenase n=1 Tax=Cymbomonas tetramitiformis TaxID=36881 RepID=A0AAE0L3G1_9CHLO|nr:hypothetical protein CYMTET_21204 [Cymbomonas tetramitiformis]|eukprot:gene14241-16845_t